MSRKDLYSGYDEDYVLQVGDDPYKREEVRQQFRDEVDSRFLDNEQAKFLNENYFNETIKF